MSRLPSLKSLEVLRILFAHGFEKVRTSGNHVRLRKGRLYVTVPYHVGKTIPKGTLRSILHQAELTLEQFLSRR